MSLFQSAVLKKYLKQQDDAAIAAAYASFTAHFHDPAIQANIREAKEEQYQEGFLRDLFVNVLGYTLNPQKGYELTSEFKNEKGSKKADGAVLENGKALAVIELKGTDTTDLATINSQAFNYKANHTHCVYVVTSNFQKLRFFVDNAVDWLEFDLFTLNAADFAVLWLCLQRDNLLGGVPKKVKAESLQQEEQVTKRLYKDYSTFKNALWQDLCTNHAEHDQLLLYKKTQKLLDRFLFVLFSEDKGLLPPNSIREIADQWEKLKELDAYVPLYDRFKKYFGYLNTGHKGQHHDIFAYNGGLFKPDELLDNVCITDAVLHPHVLTLSKYDFGTEVDVNILGHIFEHSLNEIENVTAQLEGRAVDAKKSKRKKDGVFYTPKYITKYIVENTVGRLCTEKKDELGIVDEEYAKGRKGRQKKTIEALDTKLDVYRDWLLSLTICDPACGSGAFLNQALDFLIAEHQYVDELQATLLGHSITFKDIGDHILERNIFGVDINEESVEIARLSLWLRTATKGRKLNDLSSNIKCGNSLIDDPAVAGDKAFDWKKEFPRVFEKGGFDVVIGNPPYVDIKALEPDLVKALFATFKTCENRINLYSIFIEQAYSLINDGGALSFINPNSILINSSYTRIRKLLVDDMTSIVKLPDGVFEDAKVETIIFELRKKSRTSHLTALVYPKEEKITYIDSTRALSIDKADWKSTDDCNYNIFISAVQFKVLQKIGRLGSTLGTVADFSLGITPYDKYQGHTPEVIESRAFHSNRMEDNTYKPLISGTNIFRYGVSSSVDEYIKYGEWLGAMRDERFFTEPRILVRQIVSGKPPRIFAGYTDQPLYFTQIGFGIIPTRDGLDCYLLLAILNSTLINFYHKFRFLDLEKELFQKILIANCKQLPIVFAANSTVENKIRSEAKQMISLVENLAQLETELTKLLSGKFDMDKLSRTLLNWTSLNFKGFLKELKKAKVQLSLAEEAEWLAYFNEQKAKATALQQQIDATDKQIDALVYELYGLTEEEIAVVEGN